MNRFLITLSTLLIFTAVACSDDDEPNIPSNAITLNMMIGDSETTIGGSDVYINSSNNFTTSYCGIADLGKNGGLTKAPNLTQIAQEVAVTPGHYYQITLADDIKTVAGARALPIGSNYYNVYVDSWIYDKDSDISGAKISYAECYTEAKQLPDWNAKIPVTIENDGYYYTVEHSFPKGCLIDKNVDLYFHNGSEDITDQLKYEINDNQIKLTYSMYASSYSPYVKLLVRYENVYTRVYLDFE